MRSLRETNEALASDSWRNNRSIQNWETAVLNSAEGNENYSISPIPKKTIVHVGENQDDGPLSGVKLSQIKLWTLLIGFQLL